MDDRDDQGGEPRSNERTLAEIRERLIQMQQELDARTPVHPEPGDDRAEEE